MLRQRRSRSALKSRSWAEMKQEAVHRRQQSRGRGRRKIEGQDPGQFAGATPGWRSAGRDIMEGLINGIQCRHQQGRICPDQRHQQDPRAGRVHPPRDKMLLYDNGQLIMGGLIGGMTSREPELKSTLRGLTNAIGNGVSPGIGSGFSGTNVATADATATTADADSIGRAVAKYLTGGTFRLDNRGNLQLIAAGG